MPCESDGQSQVQNTWRIIERTQIVGWTSTHRRSAAQTLGRLACPTTCVFGGSIDMTGKQFDHLNRPREIGDRVMGAEDAPDGVKGCKGTVIGRTRCRIERDRWYWR